MVRPGQSCRTHRGTAHHQTCYGTAPPPQTSQSLRGLTTTIPFHPAPGDTITHRRNTARNLTNRIRFMQGFTNDFWIVFIRLVSGEHVVIGGDDGDIVTQHAFQRGFVFWLAGSETVCRYRMPTANDERSKFSLVLSGEVSRASLARTFNDSICYA